MCVITKYFYRRTVGVDDALVVTGARVVIVVCVETALDVEDDALDGENTH